MALEALGSFEFANHGERRCDLLVAAGTTAQKPRRNCLGGIETDQGRLRNRQMEWCFLSLPQRVLRVSSQAYRAAVGLAG